MAAAARVLLPTPVDIFSSSSCSGSLSAVATSTSSSFSSSSPPSSSSRFSPLLVRCHQHDASILSSSRGGSLHLQMRASMLHGRCQRILRRGTLCPPLPLLRFTYPRCGVQLQDESRNLKSSSSKAAKRSGKKVAVEAAGRDVEGAGGVGGGGAGAASSGVPSPLFTSTESSPPPPVTDSYPGSPLMWIGVGVALAVAFSWLSKRVQQTMMQQMMRSVMSQAATTTTTMGGGARVGPGGMMMPPMFGGQMPFPSPAASPPGSSPSTSASWKMPPPPPSSSSSATATPPPPPAAAAAAVEARSPPPSSSSSSSMDKATSASAPKKSVFQDVSVDVISEAEAAASRAQDTSRKSFPEVEVLPFNNNNNNNNRGSSGGQNNTTWNSNASSSSSSTPGGDTRTSTFTVEQLEKMMEDPMVQQMIYPYLPEEMRNPETFKWMMQSPEYRRQLEEMLQNMGGGGAWDSRMGDMFKNFDLNSQEVKQQFDQIGMTPQEVVSKIMANPEVAMAFAKPNIQAAILDCSQNPLNIAKYTNDPEVMKVFTQISELFPGLKT